LGSLQVLLENITPNLIPERLRIFEKLRLARTAPVQIFSNMPMGPDGYGWMLEKLKPYWDQSKSLPPPGTKPHEPYFSHYLYCYDSFEVARQALAAAEMKKADPALLLNGDANGVRAVPNGVNGTLNGLSISYNGTSRTNGVNGHSKEIKSLHSGTNGVNGHKITNGNTNESIKAVPDGGSLQAFPVHQNDKISIRDSNELVELAQSCVKSAVLVNDYFETNPGTNPLTCNRFPSMDDKANAARLKLRNAAKELYELTTGPQEMLMEQCILSVSQISFLHLSKRKQRGHCMQGFSVFSYWPFSSCIL
jgi:hypothetical protein